MYALIHNRWEEAFDKYLFRKVYRYPSFSLIEVDENRADISKFDLEKIDNLDISVHGTRVKIPTGKFVTGKSSHLLIRFIGPLSRTWRMSMEESAIKILFWCPRYGACIRLPRSFKHQALSEKFFFIAGAQPYRQSQCRRGSDQATAPSPDIPPGLQDIVCFSREDRVRVEEELGRIGVPILAVSSTKIRVSQSGDTEPLRKLLGVKLVNEPRGSVPLMSGSIWTALGLESSEGSRLNTFSGEGQIVAIADTGLDRGDDNDMLHEDFQSRVRHISSWPINPSWKDFVEDLDGNDGASDRNSGHGTHVAGLAVGNGRRSGGRHMGVAPNAELVFQAMEQYVQIKPDFHAQIPSGYYLSGRPLDLRQLYIEAREHGAHIHVNAWGDPAQGRYTDDCFESDLFLHEHQDAVVLFAAGNDGADRDGNRLIDKGSLYAPGSAKNVTTVGATEGPGEGIGWRGNWGNLDPNRTRYRSGHDRVDLVSGEPDRMALFSSVGPTRDQRIKPDICAPGTNLVGPRSSMITGKGWGLASPLPYYMYNSGTSMATGLAGGFVALLRQAWHEFQGGRPPSGAGLKALMILGARPVLRRGENREEPRDSAGFGRINFSSSLPSRLETGRCLFEEIEPGLVTGETREYLVVIRRTGSFKATLTWYDAPGEALVNDLDLCLDDEKGATKWGNHPLGKAGEPDRTNTVEVINIPSIAAGIYKIRVIGANVPAGPQSFALAISFPSITYLDLTTRVIKGIGSAYERKLRENGIGLIGELMEVSIKWLTEVLHMNIPAARKLHNRLEALFGIITSTPTDYLPLNLTLKNLFDDKTPDPFPDKIRHRLKTSLAPLLSVFDKRAHATITLQSLFG